MMIFWYISIFAVGILIGAVCPRQPTSVQRSRPRRSDDRLDDVDQMVLWGEVNNDPFYKGQ